MPLRKTTGRAAKRIRVPISYMLAALLVLALVPAVPLNAEELAENSAHEEVQAGADGTEGEGIGEEAQGDSDTTTDGSECNQDEPSEEIEGVIPSSEQELLQSILSTEPASTEDEVSTLADEEQFQLEVTIVRPNTIFLLPTNGNLGGNQTKAINWYIDWGEGEQVFPVMRPQDTLGIPHTYETIGTYTITITPRGSTDAWLGAFGFSEEPSRVNVATNKQLITAVHGPLTPSMTRSADQISGSDPAPTYEWSNTFSGCTNLTQGPTTEGWEEITSVGEYFAANMFSGAGSATFQINDGFVFPAGIDTSATNAFLNTFALSDAAPMQNRTAASIINGAQTPPDPRFTFRADGGTSKFTDIATIDANWGGGGEEKVEQFQLEVTTPADNTTFYLPTSGKLGTSAEPEGNQTKTYNWDIDWGDGGEPTSTGEATQSADGIAHAYATAGTYTITIKPGATSTNKEAWLGAFGFTEGSIGSNAAANKEIITAAPGPLTPSMTRTAAQTAGIDPEPTYEWAYLFFGCTNLIQGPAIEGWEGVTSTGSHFASSMFDGCTSLVSLPASFNLPQGITSAGDAFASSMFGSCTSLASLPASFNLPQGITSVGDLFASSMFGSCTSLVSLPASFNLPQGTTSVGDYFTAQMFKGCTSLTSLPNNFNFSQDITSVGDYFAERMFMVCTSLTSLPDDFNLPQGLTSVDDHFVGGMFFNCTSLTSLPNNFNFSQDITSVGDYFTVQLFYGCTSLTSLPDDFNLPQGITSTGSDFAANMFGSCSSLTTLPDGFNLPQGVTSVGSGFAQIMLQNAGSSTFQINEEFKFPAGIDASGEDSFFNTLALSDAAPMQNRTAASIINGAQTPPDPRFTFRADGGESKFTDIYSIDPNWGGLVREEQFQLVVTTPADGTTFYLPTSGHLGDSQTKTYNWNIDWGDGGEPTSTGEATQSAEGIAHAYATAGTYTITIKPAGSTEAWLGAFGFDSGEEGANVPANRELVTAVPGPLTPSMTRTAAQLAGIDPAPSYEWFRMFIGCTNLTQVPSIEGWEDITSTGVYFASSMFYGCTSLISFPDSFNLPQGITSAGDHFAKSLFEGCTSLTSLPDSFNLPQGITSAGYNFAASMFSRCTSLASLPDNFSLPHDITRVGTNFAASMFSRCTSLASLPAGFNLPQGITSAGMNFADSMFLNAGSVSFQINDEFKFPADVDTSALHAFKNALALSDAAPMQNRTAASIINGAQTPPDPRFTFRADGGTSKFTDIASIDANWGGEGTAAVEQFQLEVTTPADGTTFYLPTSGHLGDSQTKTYNWNIDWGDGGEPTSTGEATQSAEGIAHAYATAGTYTITIKPAGSTEAWLGAFGFDSGEEGANVPANRELVTAAPGPLTPTMTRTAAQIAGTDPAPAREWAYIFEGCTNLTQGPTTEGWEGITSVGERFAFYMFYNCTSLTSLPEGFNLPQDLTSAGDYFANALFASCTDLTSLPAGFNLPQGLTSVGSYFAGDMFYGCSGLTLLPKGFNLPQSLETAGDFFAAHMFINCTSLASPPQGFNLPQGLTSVGESFAASMFFNAGNEGFQINDEFKFPAGVDASATDAFLNTLALSDAAPMQMRTASSIINGAQTPPSARFTFRENGEPSKFTDIALVHPNWGGTTEYEQFQLEVTTTEANTTFYLPTSGRLDDNQTKTYDWDIDWGDGETASTGLKTQDNVGIEHTYETAGVYTITIKPGASSLSVEAWLGAFGFYMLTGGANTAANKALVTGVSGPLTPLMTRTAEQIAGIDTAPSFEWTCMFYECSNLAQGPATVGWDGIESVADRFAYAMFYGCSNLISLPDGFNLPQNITSMGNRFAWAMFLGCSSLTSLPDGFNLPQGAEGAEENSFGYMFSHCTNLTSLPEGFNLPQAMTSAGDNVARCMFNDCFSLTSLPSGFSLPQGVVSTGENFAREMFSQCTSLDALPAGFNLPPDIEQVGNNFAYQMFFGAGSSAFQVNDEFLFPPGLLTEFPGAFYQTFVLSDAAPMQNRTATSIINNCQTPPDPRWTFRADGGTSKFTDIASIHENWGGIVLTTGRVNVSLALDEPFLQDLKFMVKLSETEGATNVKPLVVEAGQATAQFAINVPAGTYTIQVVSEGTTWRYTPGAESATVTIAVGETQNATISAQLKTRQWLSAGNWLLNRAS